MYVGIQLFFIEYVEEYKAALSRYEEIRPGTQIITANKLISPEQFVTFSMHWRQFHLT